METRLVARRHHTAIAFARRHAAHERFGYASITAIADGGATAQSRGCLRIVERAKLTVLRLAVGLGSLRGIPAFLRAEMIAPRDSSHHAMTKRLPPVALAISFIDCINRCDLAALSDPLSTDHRLEVFDEEPLIGKLANTITRSSYFEKFPNYVIYPRQITERAGSVAILGHTSGSHLGLRDDDERHLTLIWLVDTGDGYVTRRKLIEDNAASRDAWGLSGRSPRGS